MASSLATSRRRQCKSSTGGYAIAATLALVVAGAAWLSYEFLQTSSEVIDDSAHTRDSTPFHQQEASDVAPGTDDSVDDRSDIALQLGEAVITALQDHDVLVQLSIQTGTAIVATSKWKSVGNQTHRVVNALGDYVIACDGPAAFRIEGDSDDAPVLATRNARGEIHLFDVREPRSPRGRESLAAMEKQLERLKAEIGTLRDRASQQSRIHEQTSPLATTLPEEQPAAGTALITREQVRGGVLYVIVSYQNTTTRTFTTKVTVYADAMDSLGKVIGTNRRSFYSHEWGPIPPGFSGTVEIPVQLNGAQWSWTEIRLQEL